MSGKLELNGSLKTCKNCNEIKLHSPCTFRKKNVSADVLTSRWDLDWTEFQVYLFPNNTFSYLLLFERCVTHWGLEGLKYVFSKKKPCVTFQETTTRTLLDSLRNLRLVVESRSIGKCYRNHERACTATCVLPRTRDNVRYVTSNVVIRILYYLSWIFVTTMLEGRSLENVQLRFSHFYAGDKCFLETALRYLPLDSPLFRASESLVRC